MTRAILITDTSTRAGRVTAETLCAAGHRIFAGMRDPNFTDREQANALWSRGIEVVPLDITEDASVDRAVAMVLDKVGHIDVLINNVHVIATGVTEAFTSGQAQRIFDFNVLGLLRATRAVLPGMRQNGDGLIVNIGSIFGRVTIPFIGIYGSTQFAIEALSDSLRAELAPFGVEVVLVQPASCPPTRTEETLLPMSSDRCAAYGSVDSQICSRLPELLVRFEAAAASAMEDVPTAVVGLIKTPKWQRPARRLIGASLGADLINATVASVQARVLAELGMHTDPGGARDDLQHPDGIVLRPSD